MIDPRYPFAINGKALSWMRIERRVILSVVLWILLALYRYLLPERPLEYTGIRAVADLVFAISLLLGVLLVGGGVGLKIIRWLRVIPGSYLEMLAFAIPAGLGAFSYSIFALGLLGLLEPPYFLLLFLVAIVGASREGWELALSGAARLRAGLRNWPRINLGQKLLLIGFLLFFILTLLQALTPPWDYDGLMYHLQGPRMFLASGKIIPLPDIWQANAPFTIEMLYMFGLRFQSDTFAKLLHMSYGIALVIATFAFGKRIAGWQGGWLAATILVAIPILPIWAAQAYADMAWAVYEFLGVYAWFLWLKSDRRAWLALSAIAVGLALGSKFLGLGIWGTLGLAVVWGSRRQGWKRIFQNAAMFLGIALLIGSPWYLKNWLWTGNPIYPLYFGGLDWPAERVQLLMNYLGSFGVGHQLVDYLLLPLSIYIQYERFTTFLGSIEVLSFLYPLLVLYPFIRHKKAIHILGVIVLIRLVLWALASQQIRFLLPVFPGLSLLTASVLLGLKQTFLRETGSRILQAGLLGGVMAATAFYTLTFFLMTRPVGVLIGNESRSDFLARVNQRIPAYLYIQQQIPRQDRVMFMWAGDGYYCDERCIPDAEQSRWTYLALTAGYDRTAMLGKLHDMSVTHLLFSLDDLDFILGHDPSGENKRAALFFLNEFKAACTELIYRDQKNELYKITCPPVARE